MKRRFVFVCVAFSVLLVACGPNRNKEVRQINALESSLMDNSVPYAVSPATADSMIDLYLRFADDFPADTLTPGFMLKAGDIARNFGKFDQAERCFKCVIDKYGESAAVGDAYFLLGMTYEAKADYRNARETYRAFVREYPNHPLAHDISIQLENNMIGLSPEEMLAAVMANNPESGDVEK